MIPGDLDEICRRLRERAPQAELQRCLPPENLNELDQLALVRSLVPTRYGGLEMRPGQVFERLTAIGEACPSTAWVGSLLAVHGLILAWFPEAAQEVFWSQGPDTRASSSLAPLGKAIAVPGGISLEGRWCYASGLDHCDWLLLGARLEGRVLLALVPKVSCRCEEDWQVCGLAATGSHALSLESEFVPAQHWLFQDELETGGAPGMKLHKSSLYRTPWRPLFSSTFVPAALGAARAALTQARLSCYSRTSAFTGISLKDRPFAARALAQGESQLEMANCLWNQQLHELDNGVSDVPRATYRPARIVALCLEAACGLFPLGGAAALRLDHPLQRHLRDLQAIALHPAVVHEAALETYGRSLMQLPPGDDLT